MSNIDAADMHNGHPDVVLWHDVVAKLFVLLGRLPNQKDY